MRGGPAGKRPLQEQMRKRGGWLAVGARGSNEGHASTETGDEEEQDNGTTDIVGILCAGRR